MKVNFEGKARKLKSYPTSMEELRKIVSRKFAEHSMIQDDDEDMRMSRITESQESLMSFISQSK